MTQISKTLIELYNACANNLASIFPAMMIEHQDNPDGTTTWSFTPVPTEPPPYLGKYAATTI